MNTGPVHKRVTFASLLLLVAACLFAEFPTTIKAADHPASAQTFALDPSRKISQYAHTAWRIQDGVLPSVPEAFAQTTDGYLWIATYAGLIRFDGVKFTPWPTLHPQPLPDSRIASVYGARDGSLWIGTYKGLAHWKNGELTQYLDPLAKITSIVEDEAGTIWISRSMLYDEYGPLCEVAGAHLKCHGKDDGISFPSANRMARDDSGNFWLAGQTGLCRWKADSHTSYFEKYFREARGLVGAIAIAADTKAGVWASVEGAGAGLDLQQLIKDTWTSYTLSGVVGDPGVAALFVDRDHTVWIGTANRGIYRIHGDSVDHFSSGDGLSSSAVAGFYQDREGTLWVATSKGIDSFRDVRVASFSIHEGLTADSVSTVLASRDGTVWIGNSGALDFIKDNKIGAIRTGHGLPGRDVTTMFEDHAGQLWIGIDTGLWLYERGTFRPIAKGTVFSIAEDRAQNIWVRIGPKLVRIRDGKVQEELETSQIKNCFRLKADPTDGIWLGLTNGDLVRYRHGLAETFSPAPGQHARKIVALFVDQDGSVLAATDEGLVRWKDGVRNVLTSRNGLPCDDVYTMTKDKEGSLWLYAKCGVIQIPKAELETLWAQPTSTVTTKLLDVFDGAQPGLTLEQPQVSESADGRLWFANISILQVVDPSRLSRNLIPPPIHVEQIVADHKNYSPDGNLDLPALTSNLEFDYAALSLVIPQKVRYRYKLEGHDRDWEDPGTRRQAFYNDLPPGKFKFRVMACNNDGVWNEEGATVDFRILPAFYQTNWFVFLSLALTTYIVWAIYRWRVRLISRRLDMQFEERLAERTRIAQDLHDTLLQGVLSASMQLHVANDQLAEDAPAKPLVGRILELMKHVVDDGRNAVRGLRSSTEITQDLDKAFSRVPQELATQRPVDFRVIVEGTPRSLHPVIRDEVYRIGREAMANAFRHSEASNIEVEIEYAPHQLHLLVRDNGCGIDAQVLRAGREGHFGLSGMHERAVRIGAKLKVWSRDAGGTEVELSIPGHVAFHSRPAPHARKWFAGLRPNAAAEDIHTNRDK